MHIYLPYTFHTHLFKSTYGNMKLLFQLYVQPFEMWGIVSFSKYRSECISSPSILFICFDCFLASFWVSAYVFGWQSCTASRAVSRCCFFRLSCRSFLFFFFFGCHLAPLLPCAPELHKTADGPPRNEGISIVQSWTSLYFVNAGLCI